ncbi:MAG: hypothetical protein H8D56_03005 [Planctomycetes bacterium]|nr:hypothetical protein [Planctomycetota bacterium]MBL7144921.1 hypothetical protein [Phycisphaerae bacterium]
MTDNKAIKEFVRNTLGCNCPEEVFQYIDCRTVVNIDENIVPAYEINIGNRLLIFAAAIDEVDSLKPVLSNLVRAGIKKRDEKKFNRFRLVLLTAPDIDIAEQASEIFSSLAADEKVHLHVINKDDFPVNLHHPNFGKHLKKAMDALGIECVRKMDTDFKSRNEQYTDQVQFLKKHFGIQ